MLLKNAVNEHFCEPQRLRKVLKQINFKMIYLNNDKIDERQFKHWSHFISSLQHVTTVALPLSQSWHLALEIMVPLSLRALTRTASQPRKHRLSVYSLVQDDTLHKDLSHSTCLLWYKDGKHQRKLHWNGPVRSTQSFWYRRQHHFVWQRDTSIERFKWYLTDRWWWARSEGLH